MCVYTFFTHGSVSPCQPPGTTSQAGQRHGLCPSDTHSNDCLMLAVLDRMYFLCKLYFNDHCCKDKVLQINPEYKEGL